MLEAAAAPCAGDSPGDFDQSRGRLVASDALKHRARRSHRSIVTLLHPKHSSAISTMTAKIESSGLQRNVVSSQFQAFESIELVERLRPRTRFELATQRFAVSTSNHSVVVQTSLRLARRPIPSFKCCSCSRPVRWKSTRVPFPLEPVCTNPCFNLQSDREGSRRCGSETSVQFIRIHL